MLRRTVEDTSGSGSDYTKCVHVLLFAKLRTANHGVVRYAAQSRERAISEIWLIVDIMVSMFQRQ